MKRLEERTIIKKVIVFEDGYEWEVYDLLELLQQLEGSSYEDFQIMIDNKETRHVLENLGVITSLHFNDDYESSYTDDEKALQKLKTEIEELVYSEDIQTGKSDER